MGKHKRRLYILTVKMQTSKGVVEKKIKAYGIDSVHASACVYKAFGRNKVKIVSAVKAEE